MKTFDFKIIVPAGVIFDAKIEGARVQSTDGLVGILAGMVPTLLALDPGEVTVKLSDGTSRLGVISGGVGYIGRSKTVLLCDDMLWEDEIDVERQLENFKRQRDILLHSNKSLHHREYVLAAAALARAEARLKVKHIER